MSNFRIASAATLAATLAFGAAPAMADPVNVPLRATAATMETMRPDPETCVGAPYLLGTTTGKGVASSLGAIDFIATDCVSPGPNTFTFSNGNLTLTAANGDALRIVYSGTLLPLPEAPSYTLYSVSGTFTVVGGTGRFASASGSGYLGGVENIRNGKGQMTLTGSLTY